MKKDVNYQIVINQEEQYSIWPEWKEVPAGWQVVSQPLSKDLCLNEIEKLWLDMRPLSVRSVLK